MAGSDDQDEIDAQIAPRSGNSGLEGFNPVALMPKDVPAGKAERWRKMAKRCGQSRPAIELKCLDCCGWERPEAKRCQIRTCALWALNQRVFGGAA